MGISPRLVGDAVVMEVRLTSEICGLALIITDCLKWEELPGGDLPARYEHTSFLVGGARESTLYVFAGANQNGSLSDMWKHQKGKHWLLLLFYKGC